MKYTLQYLQGYIYLNGILQSSHNILGRRAQRY